MCPCWTGYLGSMMMETNRVSFVQAAEGMAWEKLVDLYSLLGLDLH
jgi:hypothetical protein